MVEEPVERDLSIRDQREESIKFVDYSRTGIELLNCQSYGKNANRGEEGSRRKKRTREGEGSVS